MAFEEEARYAAGRNPTTHPTCESWGEMHSLLTVAPMCEKRAAHRLSPKAHCRDVDQNPDALPIKLLRPLEP